PPDAFMFATSGEIVMQTAIGGAGTLVGPLLGAMVWLYLSDFFQTTLNLGATWRLILGIVFVLLVVFLRHGLAGAISDGYRWIRRGRKGTAQPSAPVTPRKPLASNASSGKMKHKATKSKEGVLLSASGLTKRYGGLAANSDIDFSVNH